MKRNDAIWLYNETVAKTIVTNDGLDTDNQLTPFGGAVMGANAPTVIYTTNTDEACQKRIEAAAFLREWANAIMSEA